METERMLNLLLPKGTIQSETLETFQRAGYELKRIQVNRSVLSCYLSKR